MDTLELAPTLQERLRERAAAYGKPASAWLNTAVGDWLRDKPPPLPLPADLRSPMFAYGALRPNEIAYGQVETHVTRSAPAELADHHIRTRDGLPLLAPGGRFVRGDLLWFESGEEKAYDAIRLFEPSSQYSWVKVEVVSGHSSIAANALLGDLPTKGSENEALEQWASTGDPVLDDGLVIAAELARPTLEMKWTGSGGHDPELIRPFFQLEAAYLLLMSAAERAATLMFGPVLSPSARMRRMEAMPGFAEWVGQVGLRPGPKVVDSRDPNRTYSVGSGGEGTWGYWYAVRSNLAHRGKGAWRDAGIVRRAFVEAHDVLRLALLSVVPAFEDTWDDFTNWRLSGLVKS